MWENSKSECSYRVVAESKTHIPNCEQLMVACWQIFNLVKQLSYLFGRLRPSEGKEPGIFERNVPALGIPRAEHGRSRCSQVPECLRMHQRSDTLKRNG